MEKNRKTVDMMRNIMLRTRVVLMIRMIMDSRKLIIVTSRKLIMVVHRCMTLTQGVCSRREGSPTGWTGHGMLTKQLVQ
jgi:hypothetical protein